MLRKLFTQLFANKASSRARTQSTALELERGAVVFIANMDRPVRVMPGAEPYSELASLRLRTFPIVRELAMSRPVYMLPPGQLDDRSVLDVLQSVDALVIAKFATADLIKHPDWFETLLAWLPKVHGKIRLVADQSDNYAGYNEKFRTPLLERYQKGLGEYCTLTVPCEALSGEGLPVGFSELDHGCCIVNAGAYPECAVVHTERVRAAVGQTKREWRQRAIVGARDFARRSNARAQVSVELVEVERQAHEASSRLSAGNTSEAISSMLGATRSVSMVPAWTRANQLSNAPTRARNDSNCSTTSLGSPAKQKPPSMRSSTGAHAR